jgi:hypothetical protein
VKNATALAAFQEIFWRHVRSLDDDVVRISFEKTGGMPFMFGYNKSPIHSWTSDSIAFKRYVDYMSFDLQPWFAEKYDDLFSKTEDYIAVHVRTIAADVGFDSSAAAPFDLDVTLRVLGWDAEKTAKAVRADVLGVCSWENDVYVASSSGMVIELFKTLCPDNRIFHLPLNHKGVAGHVANHLAKREAVDDTMAEWTLLSRASRVVVFLGSSSFSNSATSRGCGPPIETVSRASKRVPDLLAKMKYRVNDPKHIDHALWDNATTFRDATRDTPCEDLENSRACYARLVMVYGSPDS